MTETYELLVIGAGAAGSSAVHAAAKRGARVMQVERDKIGGTCLNYGCDPTKTLLHIAQEFYNARHSEALGLAIPLSSLEWRQVQAHVREVVDQMRGGTSDQASQQLRKEGIAFLHGEAHFVGPHEISINGQIVASERIILATGCQAAIPQIAGLREAGFLTNKEAIWLSALPQSLAIIGGGAIGIEFAQMFQRFGVNVTVIEHNEQILDKEERELAQLLRQILQDEGIEIITGAELLRVQKTATGKEVIYRQGEGEEHTIVVDELLVALGRRPAIEHLDLESIGVRASSKGIEVDQTLRTSVAHIWAAGDVASPYKFTHVASAQGSLAAHNAFTNHPTAFDERVIPWVTFTDPPLAHVGQTEEELRRNDLAYRTSCFEFQSIERALILGQTQGRIKLHIDEQGQILGAHILGARADDLLAPLILAMCNQTPIKQLAETLFPYPTLSEGLRAAAQQFE